MSDKIEKVKASFFLEPSVLRVLKVRAAKQGISSSELVCRMVFTTGTPEEVQQMLGSGVDEQQP
jgi:hypothetical protein